jgi:ABC-type antimicrobial peptide transport system permease subunit
MEARLDQSLGLRRFVLDLASAVAVLALLLAAGGIYGVTSYLVTQRTRELGVRLALGATPSLLVKSLTREALRLVVLGSLLGSAGAAALAVVLRGAVVGITPLEPVTLLTSAALLGTVATLSTALAALRATRIDPAEALRET